MKVQPLWDGNSHVLPPPFPPRGFPLPDALLLPWWLGDPYVAPPRQISLRDPGCFKNYPDLLPISDQQNHYR